MKAIKIILIIIVILAAIVLLVPLALPSSYKVERSAEIKTPVEVVYAQVADFNNWLRWDPWSRKDPGAKHTVKGTPGTKGHAWFWDGKTIGTGSLTFEKVVENKSIDCALEFKTPRPMLATSIITFEPAKDGTKVVWVMEGDLPYPVGRVMGLFLDKMLGPDFESGLANLKKICESRP